jgi:VCBS repeat-containing protein
MEVALGRRGSVGPGLRIAALVTLVAAMAALLIASDASPARAEGDCSTTARITTCTFASTGSEDTFVVPEGVSSVHVVATGAPGSVGSMGGGTAGSGAKVSGDLPVEPDDTLYVNVGGAPTGARSGNCFPPDGKSFVDCIGGFNGGGSSIAGGGGGGASDVRTVSRGADGSLASRLIVAGGGGGGGFSHITAACPTASGGRGGDAGLDGVNGGSCGSLAGGTGGKAGTQSAGGDGGSPDGQNGSLGQGAFGHDGGGGGGGYYGGGAGGDDTRDFDTFNASAPGGGGGGSNLVPLGGPDATIATDGPSITISYATPYTVDRTDDPDLSTTPSAGACTVAVDNDCSLRGAITAANANAGDDTIYLLGVSGTVNLTKALPDLSSNIDIEGPGADQLTVRRGDATGNYRIFTVPSGSVVSISGITISNGRAGIGGGISNNGTLTITASTVSGNSATIGNSLGGGVNNFGGDLTITASTISGNSAGLGGGVYSSTDLSGQKTTITNTTISGNTASDTGGGVRNVDGLTILENSTITNNTAQSGEGGGVQGYGDDLTSTEVLSTIISANQGTDVHLFPNLGTNPFDSKGYNLIGNGNATGAFDQSLQDQVGVTDPELGALADNGGPTKTHALLVGSPAVDKGNTELSTDQRGEPRPFDDPSIAPATGGDDSDIGSFEAQSVLNTAPEAKDDDATTDEDIPLSVNVLSNDTDPDGDAPQLTSVGTPAHGSATINENGTPANKTDDFVNYTPNANYYGEDSFTYTVSDGKGGTDTATVNIKVSAVNDAPTISNITDQTILEDTNTGELAFTVSDVDDAAGSLTLSGSSSDTTLVPNSNITFGGSDGSRTVKVSPAANRFGGPATITLSVSDGDESATETFDVNVTLVNDAPTFDKGADQTVDEDAGPRSVPGWATGISAGPFETQAVTFSATNDNNALFSDQPQISSNGTLTYTPAANAHGGATVTVKAQDDGGTTNDGQNESAIQTFTITVNPINDAPSFDVPANAPAVNEDSGAQSIPGFASNISAGPANESGQTLTFQVTNNTNKALFSVQPSLAPNGTLKFTPAADAFGSAEVSVRLKDDGRRANGGVDASTEQTFTITINPVNDAPRVSLAEGGSCSASGVGGTMKLTVADVDTATGGLTLSATSSNRNLLPNSNISFSGGGAKRTVTISPQANNSGTANITITVSDGSLKSTQSVSVHVGTNAANTISGTQGTDMLFGLGGADILEGAGAADLLCAGDGVDILDGANGDDALFGGAGGDVLRGGKGDDQLSGGGGEDELYGEEGADTMSGGSGADRFSGGSGTDTATDFDRGEGDTKDSTIP